VAETPDKETQEEKQPEATQQRASSRVPAILVSLSALAVIGAATANSLPNFSLPNFSLPDFNRFSLPNLSLPNFNRLSLPDFSLPEFSRFVAQSPHETASVPIPEPAVNATLKDIQLSQQQNAAALASLSQSSANEQADLKRISRQLSLVTAQLNSMQNTMTPTAQLNSVQNAMTPLTTSSIPHPGIRARVVGTSRKIIPPLPRPVGPVSVGGAPLSPAPAPGSRAG
jgi:hypothetical protein